MPSIPKKKKFFYLKCFFIIAKPLFFLFFCSGIFFLNLPISLASFAPSQPLKGPGGVEYAHNKIITTNYGTGALGYYLFEPDFPKPDSAPLIVFLHGGGETNPDSYIEWIAHIVKKGNIVVYPIYQPSSIPSKQCTLNAIQALLDSINKLKTAQNHIQPELENFAIVGHSLGAMLTINIAALANKFGLPIPKAIMPVEPGYFPWLFPFEDLSLVPPEALLLTVVGDNDSMVGDKGAKKIFYDTSQIPFENKNFIMMVSDQHGSPPLKADHSTPLCTYSPRFGAPSGFPPDALDYYCLWKLFEALTDAAFYAKNWEYALGNTPEQRYMGCWSDGTSIKELIVTDTP